MRNKYLLLFFLCLCSWPAFAQYVPPNIDFETGTTSFWSFYTGTCCPSGTFSSMIPGAAIPGRHALTSGTATDRYGGFPVVSPTGGNYSLRLGYDTTGYRAERAAYYVHIPSSLSTYNLIYHYAVVLEDPAHPASDQPRMVIKAFDSSTGFVIACDSYYYISSSSLPGFTLSPDPLGDVYYKSWSTGSVTLNGLAGRTIAMEFSAGDCGQGGHFGYGYVDMSPGLFVSLLDTCSATSITDTIKGPGGYASYVWCDASAYTTTYGTSPDLIVSAASGSSNNYALVVTPYLGYGCTDTLTSRIVVRAPCAGISSIGAAHFSSAHICNDPDTLIVSGYSNTCGFSFQWQSSSFGMVWTNEIGATLESMPFYRPSFSSYYRCAVTCSTTGFISYTAPLFVPAHPGPGLFTVPTVPSTTCVGSTFYVSTCGLSAAYRVVTLYGDGTRDVVALTTTGVRHANITHNYGFPGTYTITQKLYDAGLIVDSTSFSYNYEFCNTLPIRFYFDANMNCAFDSSESNIIPILTEVDSSGVPIDTVSAINGLYYRTTGPPGTVYTFKPLTTTSGIGAICPSSGEIRDTIQPYVNLYQPKYIGLGCTTAPGYDLSVYAVIPVTGRNDQWGHIYMSSNVPCYPTGSTLTLDHSPKYSIVGTRIPVAIVGNRMTWNIRPLTMPSRVDVYYALWFDPSTGLLSAGDTVQSHISVTPIVGDIDISNNQQVIIDTVSASCDPNYIGVAPAGYISSGTQLRYTIHFENTGNDTAFNIHVMDTLSDFLDAHSLQMMMASADVNTALFNIGGQNIIKFDFPHINLLDSSHHGLCDGMVVFKINTLTGLPGGTIIPNHAGIYFDDNDVVMTNTVNNIIGLPTTSVNELSKSGGVDIYPNPASNELIVKVDNNAYTSATITDAVGKVLISEELKATTNKISIADLAGGIYYITFKGDKGTTVRKFVKM